MSDPILGQVEVMIRKAGGMEYISAGRFSAWFYLTTQRLIIKRLFGGGASYPLSHLTKADIAEYRPSPFSLTNFNLLRLTFDNDGVILLGVGDDKKGWIQAIEEARVNAPELPYETIPPKVTASSYASPSRFLWVAILTGIAVCVLSTCTIALTMFVLLLSSHPVGA